MEDTGDIEPASLNFIPCLTWIRRGAAKLTPEKVHLEKDELAELIRHTRQQIKDIDEDDDENENEEDKKSEEDADESQDVKMEQDSESANDNKNKKGKDEGSKPTAGVDDDLDDEKIAAEYGLDTYDDEDDEPEGVMGIEHLTVFPSNDDDPYITVKDSDDESSEEEDFNLLPTDNLIAVGHIEGDAAILEVHVYNAEEAHLYVHHEILLPAFPLCIEWLDYEPGEEAPGNLVCVGSMAPVIEAWDLDVVGGLEPVFSLGRRKSKKKGLPAVGHKDAVLSLAWNKHVRSVLASGSADKKVMLWNLSDGSVASTIKSHKDKVQALQWHPFEAQTLLTGCCDNLVRVFDCRASETCKSWDLGAEVERTIWDHFNPFAVLASTEAGMVHYIDVRQEKPLWQLNAHTQACTGLNLSWQVPGCLMTASQDKSFKVWDIHSGKPEFICEHNFDLGHIHTLGACPDAPFALCLGGDNRENNFKVWDIRQNSSALSRFENRPLVQTALQRSATAQNPGSQA